MGCLKMVAIFIIAMMGSLTPQTKLFCKFFLKIDWNAFLGSIIIIFIAQKQMGFSQHKGFSLNFLYDIFFHFFIFYTM